MISNTKVGQLQDAHIEIHPRSFGEVFGEPIPMEVRSVLSSELPIQLLIFKLADCLVIATLGMSSTKVMAPGQDSITVTLGECLWFLPLDWSCLPADIENPKWGWPFQWITQIAQYPHKSGKWFPLDAPTILSNGEPPMPIALGTHFSCIMVYNPQTEYCSAILPDGRIVSFYVLVPLYSEERELEKQNGFLDLFERFERHGIGPIMTLERKNVGLIKESVL